MKTQHQYRCLFVLTALAWTLPLEADVSAADSTDASTEMEVILGAKVATDPFLGDWQGKFEKGWPSDLVAQVIPQGNGRYRLQFLPIFDHRCPPFAVLEAKTVDDKLWFDDEGWSGTIKDGKLTGQGVLKNKPTAFSLQKVTRRSPRLGATPPAGATVLFDGGSLDHWESDGRGGVKEITWKQIDDYIRVWPPLSEHSFSAAIRTRNAWQDFKLHVEFRLPLIAAATGQTRGNSGIIIEDFEFYEVQILDSYGLPGYWDETGAIYKKAAPKINACAPPGQWQSYDIEFRAAKFDEAGKLVSLPMVSVDLNGKRVQHEVELPYSAGAISKRREQPDLKTPGRITLQHHGDPIDFRNIWIVDLTSTTDG
jgi:hypothetical protein